MVEKYLVALAGNPNSGKSTIFNNLTGSRQHVGNWPGKTVEKKEGICRHDGIELEVVDLPGIYSLSAFSLEEIIARDFIVIEKPDVVISVVDASNLERNLYLTVQILELGATVVLALNMSDMADSRGYEINQDKLSRAIRSKIVRTIANKDIGTDQLIETVIEVARGKGK